MGAVERTGLAASRPLRARSHQRAVCAVTRSERYGRDDRATDAGSHQLAERGNGRRRRRRGRIDQRQRAAADRARSSGRPPRDRSGAGSRRPRRRRSAPTRSDWSSCSSSCWRSSPHAGARACGLPAPASTGVPGARRGRRRRQRRQRQRLAGQRHQRLAGDPHRRLLLAPGVRDRAVAPDQRLQVAQRRAGRRRGARPAGLTPAASSPWTAHAVDWALEPSPGCDGKPPSRSCWPRT